MNIAIIIPCYNEELTIARVVSDCKKFVPNALVYVFDNNSIDQTAHEAKNAGAIVVHSPVQGKGAVIRHAFAVIDADYIVMLDGDDTYPAAEIPKIIEKAVTQQLDMVIGTRLETYSHNAFRKRHELGNNFFSKFASSLFDHKIADIFSGFRIFSKRFFQCIHLKSRGFEIEADLTLQAISQGWRVDQVPIFYKNRPEGSHSKLNTYKDGFLILKFILMVVRDYKPLPFFSTLSSVTFALSIIAGWAPIRDYIEFSYVYTVPRAILAASLMILATMFVAVGLILDSQMRYFLSHVHLVKNGMRDTTKAHKQKSA